MRIPFGGLHHLSWLILALPFAARVGQARADARATAFVTSVSGSAQVLPVSGDSVPAHVGHRLMAGDRIAVASGKVSAVLLSGRVVTVSAPDTLAIGEPVGAPAPMLVRLSSTLEEMSGTESSGPTVHGMARAFGIAGARPANSYLRSSEFSFTWAPVEGVEQYLVRIHAAGDTLERVVADTSLSASTVKLAVARRYYWTVCAVGTPMPVSSSPAWLQIATERELAQLRLSEAALDSVLAPAATPAALRAALYTEQGFLDDAQESLPAPRATTPPGP